MFRVSHPATIALLYTHIDNTIAPISSTMASRRPYCSEHPSTIPPRGNFARGEKRRNNPPKVGLLPYCLHAGLIYTLLSRLSVITTNKSNQINGKFYQNLNKTQNKRHFTQCKQNCITLSQFTQKTKRNQENTHSLTKILGPKFPLQLIYLFVIAGPFSVIDAFYIHLHTLLLLLLYLILSISSEIFIRFIYFIPKSSLHFYVK